eukprot:CAMPEP_0206171816 /NCGR_PEP_ID=MMETSP1474-20131121/43720_1 /ASSEMBLY_ACC=CAM_ASM_001110 /TAXON_ID=97495 /ORGANISM="Imantonia sp., Strain RCC918" /LENGTH=153 /DNA_ID=CAMNT_0053579577 /DNA_START=168 /DNA_END=630 /DNA_ORIENTATION=+
MPDEARDNPRTTNRRAQQAEAGRPQQTVSELPFRGDGDAAEAQRGTVVVRDRGDEPVVRPIGVIGLERKHRVRHQGLGEDHGEASACASIEGDRTSLYSGPAAKRKSGDAGCSSATAAILERGRSSGTVHSEAVARNAQNTKSLPDIRQARPD